MRKGREHDVQERQERSWSQMEIQQIAKPFDDAKETILLTNASRLHGLGYALLQKSRKGELSLIQCRSRSLTPTQQR